MEYMTDSTPWRKQKHAGARNKISGSIENSPMYREESRTRVTEYEVRIPALGRRSVCQPSGLGGTF
ncbi:hypothetical protein HJFPF1_10407 [Paramyrothecium foliicola]|nr:hypothetical protein HJFPF1_10407 [Paramyrothecium foliicola]